LVEEVSHKGGPASEEVGMVKSTWVMFAVAIGFVCVATVAPAQSQEGVTVVDDTAFQHRQRPLAVFPHDKHNEKAGIEECQTCHHFYENGKMLPGESSEDQECSACHSLESGHNPRPLMKAYHDLCSSCHRQKKMGPVTCGACHSQ